MKSPISIGEYSRLTCPHCGSDKLTKVSVLPGWIGVEEAKLRWQHHYQCENDSCRRLLHWSMPRRRLDRALVKRDIRILQKELES